MIRTTIVVTAAILAITNSGCADPVQPPAIVMPVTGKIAEPEQPGDELAQIRSEVRDYVQRQVAEGFDSQAAIIQSAIDVYSDDLDPADLEPIARRFTKEALAKHKSVQVDWPAVTDCDRLDKAFAQLEAQGIVCRQNFTCCGTCGAAEIGAEIEDTEKTGRAVQGYSFYHMQDTESAAEGRGLYLNYGSVFQDEAASVRVGREIVAALRAQGLATDWDGSIQKRIAVTLDWKRRR